MRLKLLMTTVLPSLPKVVKSLKLWGPDVTVMDAEAVMAEKTMPDALAQADASKADAREETKEADAQEGNKDVVAALDSAVKNFLKNPNLKIRKSRKNLLISTNLHQQPPL